MSDTLKNIKCLSDVLDHSLEICKLLKYSPRRDAIFHKLHQELSPQVPGIRNLCPTRWTVRALSLESIRLNYTTLEATWSEASEVATQSEVKSRINGVASKMKEFDFLFGLMLAERILKHTDNLSKTIQATTMPAVEARGLSKLCIQLFKKIRTEDCFDQFWELTKSTQCLLHVKDSALPRARKRPLRYEDGTGEAYHPSTPKNHYRQIYFQCLDGAIMTVDNRFNQKDFIMYSKLEELIIKAATKTDYTQQLQEVVKFFGADFVASDLETHLELLGEMKIEVSGEKLSFNDIHQHFKSLSTMQLSLVSQVTFFVKLILLMPATNAVLERSALAMCRVKTYLHSTMTQSRLNNIMVLHIHKHLTDSVDLKQVLNEFASANDERRRIFGSF